MGLGKTLQVIAVLLDYKEKNEDKKSSIVISPSSLSLNWKNEIEKFAPNMNILVIRGTYEERKNLINELENYDLIITSYD